MFTFKAKIAVVFIFGLSTSFSPQPSFANPADEPSLIMASSGRIICREIAEERDGYEVAADKISRQLLADLDMSGDDNAAIAQLTLPVILALKGKHPQHFQSYHTLSAHYEDLKQTTLQRRCRLKYRPELNSFLAYVSSRIN